MHEVDRKMMKTITAAGGDFFLAASIKHSNHRRERFFPAFSALLNLLSLSDELCCVFRCGQAS